jgi:O-antigen/teichoic acid export membrane protein
LTPATAAGSYLCANAVTLVVATLLVARAGEFGVGFSSSAAKDLVSFGVKSHISNVSSILNERLDQVVISAVLAPAKLGLYVVAVTLTSLVSLVGSSVALVALPVLARLRSAPEQVALTRRLMCLTLGSASLIAMPMFVFTPELLALLFGQSFRAAADPARILLLAGVLLTTSRVLGAILKALGRPLQAGYADAAALAVTAVGLAVLLPAFGLVGAAISSLLAYGLSLGWMVHRTARVLSVRPVRLFLPERVIRRSATASIVPTARGGSGP